MLSLVLAGCLSPTNVQPSTRVSNDTSTLLDTGLPLPTRDSGTLVLPSETADTGQDEGNDTDTGDTSEPDVVSPNSVDVLFVVSDAASMGTIQSVLVNGAEDFTSTLNPDMHAAVMVAGESTVVDANGDLESALDVGLSFSWSGDPIFDNIQAAGIDGQPFYRVTADLHIVIASSYDDTSAQSPMDFAVWAQGLKGSGQETYIHSLGPGFGSPCPNTEPVSRINQAAASTGGLQLDPCTYSDAMLWLAEFINNQ